MATKRLMTDEQVEVLKLVESADSVELKPTVPAMYGRNAAQALGNDPLEAQIRQVFFKGDGGRIINITSVHEDWPMPGNTPYCLSKGGMRMLTRTAGIELGPHDITVVAVATPIKVSTMEDPETMKTLDAAIPLGRMAEPDDIGSVVAFLAGDGRAT